MIKNITTKFTLLFLLTGLAYSGNKLVAQSTPASGDIVFTQVDGNSDQFEFMTLKRLDLSGLKFSDNGVCTNGTFRMNETTSFTTNLSSLTDVPAGTFVRIFVRNQTYTNDANPDDGLIIFVNNQQGMSRSSGDNIIAYTGTAAGAANCAGTGTNTYVSGIIYRQSWNTGATNNNNSKAPGTATDFQTTGTPNNDGYRFSGTLTGTAATLAGATTGGIRNMSNWSGYNAASATDNTQHRLKNILFNESNYSSGSLSFSSVSTTGFTINTSGLTFSGTNSDTRYMVVIEAAATPSTPVDRYTCYSGISTVFTGGTTVVTAVGTAPCGSTTTGAGKVVYFGYNLPSSLAITGLTAGVNYQVKVVAVNGNGNTANVSSTPATDNQTTCTGVPTFSACPTNQTGTAGGIGCTATVSYTATATGSPAPTVTYAFTGATTASGSGTGSGSSFNVGITNVVITATSSCGTATCSFTVTVNAAEINVKGNAVSIVDGDITPALADSTDFGSVGTGTIRRFTIENTGNATLNISSIILSGTNASDFSIIGAPGTVAAAGSATFSVKFTPSATGTRTATITLNNDDCDEAAYDFAIQASNTSTPGAALNFDGVDDVVKVAGGGGLNNLQTGTIEMWVKWTGTQDAGYSSSSYGAVLARQSNGVFTNQLIALNGSNPATAKIIWNPYAYGTTALTSTAAAGDGVWNHIAITYTSGSHKMYVNGSLVATSTTTGSINNDASKVLTIGGWIDDGQGFSTSTIDEVRVWNRELCQGEILSHMNCEIATSGTGLLSNYHLNQGVDGGNNSGVTSATDATGNGNTGTLTNLALAGTTSNWIAPGAVTSGGTCSPYLAPEINIKGNSVSVSDGDITPSLTDSTDFGSVISGTKRQFTIENTGTGTLNIYSILLSGTNASDFSVSNVPSSIANGSSAAFTVTFNPGATGVRTATITITNDDCDEASYDLAIQADNVLAERGVAFDGSNDFISVPARASITAYTLEGWVKFNASVADQNIFMMTDNAGPTSNWSHQIKTNSSGNFVHYTWDGSTHFVTSTTTAVAGTWYHVAITASNGGNARLFINGIEEGTASSVGTLWNGSGNKFMVGTNTGFGANFLNGVVDEFRVWNTARTAAQISANMNCDIAQNANLDGYYRLNQGIAGGTNTGLTTVTDYSGNNFCGTLNNSALSGSTSNWVTAVLPTCSPIAICNSTNTLATAVGIYTSSTSTTDGSGFTHYCDCQGNLLLSLKLGGTGAVIPENGIELKITSTNATFYANGVGFVTNQLGWAGVDRTWNVTPSSQPSSKVPVRFYFNNNDITAVSNTLIANGLSGIGSSNDMSFYKVTNAAKPAHAAVSTLLRADVKVQMHGAVASDTTWITGTPSIGNYYAEFLVSGFSGGGGGAGPLGLTPLPVEILSFTGKREGSNGSVLNWTAVSENNDLQQFDVQRSTNINNFSTVGSVMPNNDGSYNFHDVNLVSGKTYYYRLKVKLTNGTYSYTNVVAVTIDEKAISNINIYPVPASNALFVDYGVDCAGNCTYNLVETSGRLITSGDLSKGINKINTSAMTDGLYVLRIINGEEIRTFKVMIKH